MSDVKVSFSASGAEQVVSSASQVKASLQGVGTTQTDLANGSENMGGRMGDAFKLLSLDAALEIGEKVVSAFIEAGQAIIDFSQEGAALTRMEESGESLARSMGLSYASILNSVRTTSLGMVSDADLVASTNRALMLGVAKDADTMGQLMEVAAIRGRAMGLSTQQAFDDIVTGIGRTSPVILDNLGIVVDAQANYEKYAASIGKSAKELSKAEKQQALLNAVLESTKPLLEANNLEMDTAGKWEAMQAAQTNYFDSMKKDLSESTSGWADFWAAVFNQENDSRTWDNLKQNLEEAGLWTAEMTARMQELMDTEIMRAGGIEYEVKVLGIEGARTLTSEFMHVLTDFEVASANVRMELGRGWEIPNQPAMNGWVDLLANADTNTKEWLVSTVQASYAMSDFDDQMGDVGGGAGWNAVKDLVDDLYGVPDVAEAAASALEALGEVEIDFKTDWGSIKSYALEYNDLLGQISDNDERIGQLNEIIAAGGGELDGVAMSAQDAQDEIDGLIAKNEELKQSMQDLANQTTLRALESMFAIGGTSEAEIQSLYDFMINAGMITAEAAEQSMASYKKAINDANALAIEAKIGEIIAEYTNYKNGIDIVNGMIVDKKTGEIIAEIYQYEGAISVVDGMVVDDKTGKVLLDLSEAETDYVYFNGLLIDTKTGKVVLEGVDALMTELNNINGYEFEGKTLDVTVRYNDPGYSGPTPGSGWGGGVNPGLQALGGPVYENNPYIVGERGPELFVPNTQGSIIPNYMLGGETNASFDIDYQRLGRVISESIIEAAEEGRIGNNYMINENGRREMMNNNFELLRAYGSNR